MSRIGKKAVAVPAGVTVTIEGQTVTVKGPKGQLAWTLPDEIEARQDGQDLVVAKRAETRRRNQEEREAAGETTPSVEYVYGEVDEPGGEAPEPEPLGGYEDRGFQLFFASLDSETRELLTVAELREIYASQLKKKQEERRAEKRRAAVDQAAQAAMVAEGMIPADAQAAIEVMRRNSERMRLKIQLPPADEQGNVADIGLRIDHKVYLDGHTYELSRAQFDSYREILYRSAMHELEFLGMNRRRRSFFVNQRMGNDPRWNIDMQMGDT